MITQVFAIRGATTAGDTKDLIFSRTKELLREIIAANGLDNNPKLTITSIICSSTADITEAYPAAAIREAGFTPAPLFSCLEPPIKDSLPFCIRLLVNVTSAASENKTATHVYLHGAVTLRPDLTGK